MYTWVEVGWSWYGRWPVQGGGGGGDGEERGHQQGRQQGPHLIIGAVSETRGSNGEFQIKNWSQHKQQINKRMNNQNTVKEEENKQTNAEDI